MKKFILMLLLFLAPLIAHADPFQGDITVAIKADQLPDQKFTDALIRLEALFPPAGLSDSHHGVKDASIIGQWVEYVDGIGDVWLVNNFKASQAYTKRDTEQKDPSTGVITNLIHHGVDEITAVLIAQIKGDIPEPFIKITDVTDYQGSGKAQLTAWGLTPKPPSP